MKTKMIREVIWIVLLFIVVASALLAVLGLKSISKTEIHVQHTDRFEVGLTCADGHIPVIIGIEEQTLIVTCARVDIGTAFKLKGE